MSEFTKRCLNGKLRGYQFKEAMLEIKPQMRLAPGGEEVCGRALGCNRCLARKQCGRMQETDDGSKSPRLQGAVVHCTVLAAQRSA